MALIKCCECGKEISDKAGACPNCGAPVKITQKSNGFIAAVNGENLLKGKQATEKEKEANGCCLGCLVVVGIILYLIFGNSSSNNTSQQSNQNPYRNVWGYECLPDFGTVINDKTSKDEDGTYVLVKFYTVIMRDEKVYFQFLSTFESCKQYITPKSHKMYRYYCEKKYDLADVGYANADERYKALCKVYKQTQQLYGKEDISGKNKIMTFECTDGVTITVGLKTKPYKSKSGVDTYDSYIFVDAVSKTLKKEASKEQ